jgi:flagellar motor protein MotB
VVVAVQPVRYGGYFPTTEEWVRLPVQIVFEEGSALDEADRTVLRGISDAFAVENQTLGRGIVRVRASGYSDLQREQPPGLGMARAEAVVEFFVTERGIPRQFFEVVDMGDGAAAGAAVDQASPSRVELMFLVHRQYDFEAPPDTEGQAPD